jgi:tyramine---L-glutamate ligase
MLQGLIQDCNALRGIEPHTLVGHACAADLPAVLHHNDPSKGWLRSFCELLDRVDAALIIAPEFNRILETLTLCAEESGKLVLGSSSAAVALTADKATCASCWSSAGVQIPDTVLVHPLPVQTPWLRYPIVLKPRDGAGSLSTIFIPDANSWDRAMAEVRPENPSGEWIAQKFVPGQTASVACLVFENDIIALPPASQRLSDDGRFHYLGGELPLDPSLWDRAQTLAKRALAPIDGLRGYVGVDMVLGAAVSGNDDRAIEINPRITTSYLGLRALSTQNLLGAIVAACQQQPVPQLSWHSGTVEFQSDGTVLRK